MAIAQLNGKTGEVMRWILGGVVAVLVAYFTALGAVESRLTAVETAQRENFAEIQRSLSRIEIDIREMRSVVATR